MVEYICEKCRDKIQELDDIVDCPKCGKNYHRVCWESVPNCVNCQGFNKDYAKAKIGKVVNSTDSDTDAIQKRGDSSNNMLASDKSKASKSLKESTLYNSSTFHYNIGGKLKGGATLITVVGIIIGIIVAIIMTIIDSEFLLAGLIIGTIIGVIGWLSSILLYAYGELVSSAEKTANVLIKIYEEIKEDE